MYTKCMNSLLKQWGAWVPLAMSFAAFALLVGYVAVNGTVQEPGGDEGTAAHLFQILMAGQLPIIGFFALKWLPRMPQQALGVLALQFVAGVIPFAVLFFFEH